MSENQSHTVAHILGEITWLLSQTPAYRTMSIADLESAIMPALLLNQFRIFHDANKHPVGFAVWACLSETVENEQSQRLLKGKAAKLNFQDWKSGNRIWLLELISPYATEENNLLDKLKSELAETVFNGQKFHYWQMSVSEKTYD
jgi:cytolysin-activating lysine-acyltransferase